MLKKYNKEFEEMYERISEERESPLEIIKDYVPLFEKEELGTLEIFHYLSEYIKENQLN